MRGKHAAGRQHDHDAGITPAHAGKTLCIEFCEHDYRDHPRACGENLQRLCKASCALGSPPRMRGKLNANFGYGDYHGITPAHAGKTTPSGDPYCLSLDHPRACGENPIFGAFFSRHRGSPPRMRGKHRGGRGLRRDDGITPAHAGKTQ